MHLEPSHLGPKHFWWHASVLVFPDSSRKENTAGGLRFLRLQASWHSSSPQSSHANVLSQQLPWHSLICSCLSAGEVTCPHPAL